MVGTLADAHECVVHQPCSPFAVRTPSGAARTRTLTLRKHQRFDVSGALTCRSPCEHGEGWSPASLHRRYKCQKDGLEDNQHTPLVFTEFLHFFPLFSSSLAMGLDQRGGIAVGEVIFYIPVLIVSFILVLRHGFRRQAGWIFLFLLSNGEFRTFLFLPIPSYTLL